MSATFQQLRTARVLGSARLHGLSSAGSRAAAWLALAIATGVVVGASRAGDLVREVARDGQNVGRSSRALLGYTLDHGDQLVTAAVAVAVLVGLLNLGTNTRAPRLIEAPWGAIVSSGTVARYVESLLASLLSVVPVVQVAVLTAAASLVTAAGPGRARAVAVAWTLAAVVHLLYVAALWWMTPLSRAWPRWASVASVAAFAAAALSAAHYGLARWLAAADAASLVTVGSLVLVLAVTCGLSGAGRARNVPRPVAGAAEGSVRIPTSPRAAALSSLALAAWRAGRVRGPYLTIVVATVAVCLVVRTPTSVASACIVVPLTWSLAFSANLLAVHGAGAGWLVSLPRVSAALLPAGALLAVVVPLTSLLPVAAFLAWTDVDLLVSLALAGAATVTLMAGLSVNRSVRSATGAGVGRGGALLSDAATIGQMLWLTFVGTSCWLATSWPTLLPVGQGYTGWRLVACAVAVLTGAGLLWHATRTWPRHRQRALALAGME